MTISADATGSHPIDRLANYPDHLTAFCARRNTIIPSSFASSSKFFLQLFWLALAFSSLDSRSNTPTTEAACDTPNQHRRQQSLKLCCLPALVGCLFSTEGPRYRERLVGLCEQCQTIQQDHYEGGVGLKTNDCENVEEAHAAQYTA